MTRQQWFEGVRLSDSMKSQILSLNVRVMSTTKKKEQIGSYLPVHSQCINDGRKDLDLDNVMEVVNRCSTGKRNVNRHRFKSPCSTLNARCGGTAGDVWLLQGLT